MSAKQQAGHPVSGAPARSPAVGDDLAARILDRVQAGLHQQLTPLSDAELADVDAEWVADAMLRAVPTKHPFEELGPFYDTTGVTHWLGISRQAVHQRMRARTLLACSTAEGEWVYPAWQFTPEGHVLPGLVEVLKVLLAATDPWTAAVWLTTAVSYLGEQTAVEWLREGGDWETVLMAARDDADRWTQ